MHTSMQNNSEYRDIPVAALIESSRSPHASVLFLPPKALQTRRFGGPDNVPDGRSFLKPSSAKVRHLGRISLPLLRSSSLNV